MSRTRLLIAALTTLALLVLIGWQTQREQLIKACLDAGAVWDGARSACKPLPNRPILQRDLQRS
jgi:hypothetical protein